MSENNPENNPFKQMKRSEAKRSSVDTSLAVKDEELLTFTESCRDLYETGVPINEIMRQLQRAIPNKNFSMGIGLLVDDLENGKLLSEAMGRFPKVFGDDYRSLIRAAEKSGKWTRKRDRYGEMKEGILDMLINYLKRRKGARERVKAGLIYPSFIIGALLVAVAFFAFLILPTLKDLFSSINPNLVKGSITGTLFTSGEFVREYWWLILITVGGVSGFIYNYFKSDAGKKFWAHYQLRARGVAPIFVNMNMGEIMWLMGTLFSAGLTPQEVLEILASSTTNQEISKALELAKEYLYQGIPFCDALKKAHWTFDGQVYMVISSAQKSGTLGSTLQNYASQLFEKVDQGIDKFLKMLEPAILIVAGIFVGILVIGFYGGLSGAVAGIGNNGMPVTY
ncbi:MAG: type II secretion system F family protein [Acidobacteria bacterium]|nr:type II secretion system F family protein [Acidobacteriota bacterium]